MTVKRTWKINKDLLVYKTFYFFYFGSIGTIIPYLPVYLRQIGLSAFAVGLLVGVRPIIQLGSAPFWTVIADKFKKRKSILIMSIMAWLIMTIALVFVEPTEEICELTARNRSHSVYRNYTTFRTGFFKRSTETWRLDLARTTRESHGKTPNEDGSKEATKKKKYRNIFNNNQINPSNAFSQFSTGLLDGSNPFPGQDKYPRLVRQDYLTEKRETSDTSYLALNELNHGIHEERSNDRKRKKGRLWPKPKRMNSPNEPKRSRFSAVKNVGLLANTTKIVSQTAIANETNKLTTLDSKDFTVKANRDEAIKSFDPFNMNGKDKKASAQLTKFFDSFQNATSSKPVTDAHYYNMNGVENHRNKTNKTDENLAKFLSKLNLGNLTTVKGNSKKHSKLNKSKNSTLRTKPAASRLVASLDESDKFKKSLTITQKNLFKSNHNEMRRLFVILLVLIVVGEFLETPSSPLSDASLLEYLGEDRIHYGKQRLWGSLGQGLASFFVGSLLERTRHLTCGEEFIDYTICFCVFTVLMLTTLVITANFQFRYKDSEKANDSVLSTVLTVHYVSFLAGACYMGICHGLLHNFLTWFLEDLGGSKTLMGLAIGSRCSADLITFSVASQLIQTFGQIKIAFVALISYGTILIAYSNMTNPWFALGVEFLGGLTYAASWSACTSYLAEAAPQESVATMQGILQGVYWGLGTGTGAILGGHLIHIIGVNLTFRVAATGSFVVALLFAATQWKWQREQLDDSLGIYDYSSGEPKDTEALLPDKLREKSKMEDHSKRDSKHKERRWNREKKHGAR